MVSGVSLLLLRALVTGAHAWLIRPLSSVVKELHQHQQLCFCLCAGTLTPIVSQPDMAFMSEQVRHASSQALAANPY